MKNIKSFVLTFLTITLVLIFSSCGKDDNSAIQINGVGVGKYTIAAELERKYYKEAAELLQNAIYESVGDTLDIVDISEADDRSIIIRHGSKDDEESFSVFVDERRLIIECAYDNMLESATESFIKEKISSAEGKLNFKGNVYNQDVSVVYYEDFGAVGDGVTDDFKAIYDTHQFANISGQTVKAKSDAKYYIYNSRFVDRDTGILKYHTITIKTNVDFSNAEFIIDDRKISTGSSATKDLNKRLFKVENDSDRTSIQISDTETLEAIAEAGINRDTTHINIKIDGWDGPLMIIPYNSSHNVYRRRSYSAFAGEAMHEVILLDKDGRVSEETPINFNYTYLSSITVYKLDPSRAITIKNGTFTTLASSLKSGYIYRNFSVSRSYTTLNNIKHYVDDILPLGTKAGPAYQGFFEATYATDVTFDSCVLTAKRYYDAGTYDFSAKNSNKVVLTNCTQSNFWVTVDENYNIHNATRDTEGAITSMSSYKVNGTNYKMFWGIGGSNYCKNIEYIDSTLSRFDAHAGLYNGKIINSTINGMEITGNGNLILENVELYNQGGGTSMSASNSIFYLRGDYGSTWEGDIKVKDLDVYFYTTGNLYLFYHSYANWYFGYTSCFPNISIDNLDLYDIKTFKPIEDNREILFAGSTISSSSKMHLPESHKRSVYSILDKDIDGYVDEPLFDRDLDGAIDPKCDLDNNGIDGNTSINYSEAKSQKGKSYTSGYTHPTSYTNLNIIRPPREIKIVNNDGVDGRGGYTFVITNTAGNNISDGKYYSDTDSYGGFLGGTTFIYGNGEGDFFLGTDHTDQTKTTTFKFQ